MDSSNYKYAVEQCDVSEAHRNTLMAYREHRQNCLDHLQGRDDTSIVRQIQDLIWHTMTYRTLNEARSIETGRSVNGELWHLVTAGYASLMTMGIRRLVDKHNDAMSVYTLIEKIARRPEFLTRELFVCYDGVPFDHELAFRQHGSQHSSGQVYRPDTDGPSAWGVSQMRHQAFSKVSSNSGKEKRFDKIPASIFSDLKERLKVPVVVKVCNMADKVVAHTEDVPNDKPVPIATYNDIDEALGVVIRVANAVGLYFFYDQPFGDIVPTPQYDFFESLDQPWVLTENLPVLARYWQEQKQQLDRLTCVD